MYTCRLVQKNIGCYQKLSSFKSNHQSEFETLFLEVSKSYFKDSVLLLLFIQQSTHRKISSKDYLCNHAIREVLSGWLQSLLCILLPFP